MNKKYIHVSLLGIVTLLLPVVSQSLGHQPKEKLSATGIGEIVVEAEAPPEQKSLHISQKSIHLSKAQPCSITVQLPRTGQTTLSVLDEKDKVIEVLVNKKLEAGPHAFFWNTDKIKPGKYSVLLKTPDEEKKDTITILK